MVPAAVGYRSSPPEIFVVRSDWAKALCRFVSGTFLSVWPYAFSGRGEESDDHGPDGLSIYRYWIERRWSEVPDFVLWVMFNPSTATISDDNDDRAVPRCFKRSQRIVERTGLMIGAMRVVNLFARRATMIDGGSEPWPRGHVLKRPTWVGPDNDVHIAEQSAQAALTIVAWGPSLLRGRRAEWRADQVEGMVRDPWCLGVNAEKHPYYAGPRGAPMDTEIVPLAAARLHSTVGSSSGT